jgi:excisionase family DNA binding protein
MAAIQKLAYRKVEAAEALGVSLDYLEEHVMPDLRVVRKGRLVLIPAAELGKWLERNAATVLGR